MRTIEEIDDLIEDYSSLRRAVFHAAKTHLKQDAALRYAELESFYVENGKIIADIGYSGPYSGTTEVELLREEVAFI
jgi:hypothetical protein